MTWFGCCLIILVSGIRNGLSLSAAILSTLLTFYGYLLFSQSGHGGKGHQLNRVYPWILLFAGFWGVVYGPSWEQSVEYRVHEPLRDPESLPLALDGVQLSMNKNEVEEALGPPTRIEKVHQGNKVFLGCGSALKHLELLLNCAPQNPGVVCLAPSRLAAARRKLEELVAAQGPDFVDPTASGWRPAAREYLELVKSSASGKARMTVWVADGSLQQAFSDIMSQLPAGNRKDEIFLVLSLNGDPGNSAFYTETTLTKRYWHAKTALFYEKDSVVQVSGQKVTLGSRVLAEVGERFQPFEALGRPLTVVEDDKTHRQQRYLKVWNGGTLALTVTEGNVTKLILYHERLR